MIRSTGMLLSLLTVVAWTEFAHANAAEASLPKGMVRLAEAVDKFFNTEGFEKSVKLGTFTSPDAEGNTQLRLLLEESLKKSGFEIKPRAAYSINGRFLKEFREGSDESSGKVALRVKAEIRDKSDEVIQPISIPIFGDDAVGMLGPTAELPTDGPQGSEPERQKELNEQLDNPHVAIVGSETRATSASPFGMEILVGRSPRTPKAEDGQAMVPLSKGEEYLVRLHNRAPFEVAVALTIDGLSMFAFSQEGSFGSQVLVPPGGSLEIPGWYITKDNSAAFEITTLGKGAAAIKGDTGTVGVITARFSAAWDPKGKPPTDEALTRSTDAATGLGRPVEKKYEQVQRVIGRTRAFVSVRYNR